MADLEAVEFVNRNGQRLSLDGEILGWSDTLSHDLVRHKILKRPGAVHQTQKAGARKFTLRALLSANLTARYKEIERFFADDPFVTMIHPRFSRVPVVFEGGGTTEDLDQAVNTLEVTLNFEESGIRTIPQASTSAIAQTATQTAGQLVGAAATSPANVRAAAARVTGSVGAFADTAATVSNTLPIGPLRAALAQVALDTEATIAACGSDLRYYGVVALARLVHARCLEAYNRAAEQRPPLITRPVPGRISLARWCVALYGAAAARTLEAEIAELNRIATPYGLPAGARMLIPDPEAVARLGVAR